MTDLRPQHQQELNLRDAEDEIRGALILFFLLTFNPLNFYQCSIQIYFICIASVTQDCYLLLHRNPESDPTSYHGE